MIQLNILRILGFSKSSLPSNYLGVPLVENYLKFITWEDLLNSLEKRLIPIYFFLALASSKDILNTIHTIQQCFLWQGVKEGKKWALVK